MKLKLKFFLPLAVMAVVTVLTVSCGSKYSYETVKGDPLKTRIYTLDNGLKVYMSVNKETPRIQTYIAVKVGAKNDPAETTGLAHYFEHLMFKGTQQFGTQDYAAEEPLLDQIEQQFEIYRLTTDENERREIYRVIDSLSFEASRYAVPNEYDKLMSAIGATGTNAYTGYDMTVYIENIPSNQVENWAMIQSDRFKNPVLRGFHTELETVYEENNMNITNDGRKMYQAMMSALFPTHPYGTQTVLGTQDHLKNPSIINIKNYHSTWYVPNNMAVCLAGDFDPDEMIEVVDRYFGDMKPNPELPTIKIEDLPEITEPIFAEVRGLDAEFVNIAWRTNGMSHKDGDVLSLMSSILSNGKAGLIDLNLLQQQKILGGGAGYSPMADHGMFIIQGRPKGGQTLDDVVELLMAEADKLRSGEFDENLLKATINNYKASFMGQLDSNDGRANMFVNSFLNGIDWKDEVEELDRLSRVTKEDVIAMANKVLSKNNYAVIYKRQGLDQNENTIAKPEITPILMNRDAASDFLVKVATTPVKEIEPVFVNYDRDMKIATAQSGIPVLYVQNKTNDLFTLRYVYETGSNNDPGMNTAFSYLEFLGTSKYTPEEIKQEFYNIACNFSVGSGTDRSFVTISGLGENMGRAMELFEEILADAQPNPYALENMKDDIRKRRANSKHNQSANFNMLRSFAMYGPKSPSTNIIPDAELNALTPEDMLSKIRQLSSMEHRVLYFGPLSEKELLAKLKEYHRVPEQLQPAPQLVMFPIQETPANKVYVVHYDAPQIYYGQFSNRGEKFDPSNDAVLTMYNDYFGGGMNSIVFQEMREARALAYSASASLSSPSRLYNPYTFGAFIATQNDKMVEAIEAFEDIINNMPESEAAYNLSKESLISKMRTARTRNMAVLTSYMSAQDMGIDFDRNKALFEKVQNTSLEDVKAFQQEWIKNRNYTYYVLGDLNNIDMGALRQYGPVTVLSKEEIFGY